MESSVHFINSNISWYVGNLIKFSQHLVFHEYYILFWLSISRYLKLRNLRTSSPHGEFWIRNGIGKIQFLKIHIIRLVNKHCSNFSVLDFGHIYLSWVIIAKPKLSWFQTKPKFFMGWNLKMFFHFSLNFTSDSDELSSDSGLQ